MIIEARVQVELTGEEFQSGDQWVYPARILNTPSGAIGSDVLTALLKGCDVQGQRTTGIEMFATFSQHNGAHIGVRFKNRIEFIK